jgi:hypothetical protein
MRRDNFNAVKDKGLNFKKVPLSFFEGAGILMIDSAGLLRIGNTFRAGGQIGNSMLHP